MDNDHPGKYEFAPVYMQEIPGHWSDKYQGPDGFIKIFEDYMGFKFDDFQRRFLLNYLVTKRADELHALYFKAEE